MGVGSPQFRSDLAPWSADEREDFFDAIARHRRAAWRVTFACAFASTVLALVASVLLAPLLYCLIGLALDIVNLAVPMPDLLGFAARAVQPFVDSEPHRQIVSLPWVVLLALLPGLSLIFVAIRVLERALRRSPLFQAGAVVGRTSNAGVLSEQRFRNTVEEMAIAAGIAAPRVLIVDGGANAAAFGTDDAHAIVLIGSALLDSLGRDEMQGVAGHLVSSIADGDMRIGLRTALTLGLFALYARMGSGFTDRSGFAATRRLFAALIWPSQASTHYLLQQLSDPFVETEPAPPRAAGEPEKLTWRDWAMMPLAGPVIFAGLMCGIVSTMMLTPLIALAWRERKYMADAAAVRLTRNPDGIADSLIAIARAGASRMPAWAAHLCVVSSGAQATGNLLGSWGSSIAFPPIAKRRKALEKLGATPRAGDQTGGPFAGNALRIPLMILIGSMLALVGVLMCVVVVLLVWLSVALTMLFTLLPTVLIHALLR